jgi:DNA-binding CsgD family transcriptional regulator/tetratricopeptide (TPR) repeat protein
MEEKRGWRTKLVGRASALDRLDSELRRSAAGEFRCVLISGDPGLGKTRLASEVLQTRSGRLIRLSARGFPLGEISAFGVWAEAIDSYLRTLDPEQIEDVCGSSLPTLATFSNVLARHCPAPPDPPNRSQLLEAIAELLRNLANRKPVAVLLDDMHLSDASSWELLLQLSRRLPDSPLLVVLTGRPAELAQNPEGAEVTSRLEQDLTLTRIGLEPLDRPELEELAAAFYGEIAPGALVDWLAGHSHGNPLFALGLLQALADEGAPLSHPRLRAIPEPLVERVKSRLRNLPQDAHDLLELLSVLGRRVEIADLQRMAAQPLERLAPALDVLVASRLLEEGWQGRKPTYEISHPLIRETIYQEIRSGRRLVLHRAAALSLVALGRPAEASSHFLLCGASGDDEAIQALGEALAQAAKRRAPKEALTILAGLVDVVPPGDKRWLKVLESMSSDRPGWLIDPLLETRPDMAAIAFREIENALTGTDDLAALANVKLQLSHVLAWGTGQLAEAETTCSEAVELFEEVADRSQELTASSLLAFIRGFQGDLEALRVESQRIVELTRDAGPPTVEMQAHWGVGLATCWLGEFDQATVSLLESVNLARTHKACRPFLYYCLGLLACSFSMEGRSKEALQVLEEARSTNPEFSRTVLPDWSALILWMAGDYPGAVESSLQAHGWQLRGLSCRRGVGLASAALAAIETDRLADARSCVLKTKALYGERRFFFYSDLRHWAEGLLLLRGGNSDEALEVLQRTALSVEEICPPYAALIHVDAAEAGWLSDRTDTIVATRARLREIAARTGREFHKALYQLSDAWVHLASGEAEKAAASAEKATELLADSGNNAFLGRAFELFGQCLSNTDPAGSVRALETAASLFERCGATWRHHRTLVELKRSGARGEKLAARALGAGALTRREREVARLAAQGNTAETIASRLYISDRTVEWHLSNAYAKLGVENRRELTRRIEQLGL